MYRVPAGPPRCSQVRVVAGEPSWRKVFSVGPWFATLEAPCLPARSGRSSMKVAPSRCRQGHGRGLQDASVGLRCKQLLSRYLDHVGVFGKCMPIFSQRMFGCSRQPALPHDPEHPGRQTMQVIRIGTPAKNQSCESLTNRPQWQWQ